MRDPNRIDEFCDLLAECWHKVPDWRFGQLVSNVLYGRSQFYIEDDVAADTLRKYFHIGDGGDDEDEEVPLSGSAPSVNCEPCCLSTKPSPVSCRSTDDGCVPVELLHESHAAESSYYSYRCANGGVINVEVEGGGFATIREEPAYGACDECCSLSGGWDGSLSVRPVRPCWIAEVRSKVEAADANQPSGDDCGEITRD